MIINNNNEKESTYPQCALQLSRGSLYFHSQLKKEIKTEIWLFYNKYMYRRTNQIQQQQQQQQQQTTNKQTKKGLILTTSGQGRLDELVL